MDCRAVLEEVNNYLDRQVGGSVAAQIELHLSCCPNCKIVYDTVAKTVRLYCTQRLEVPEAVRQRVHKRLKQLANKSRAGVSLEAEAEEGFSILKRNIDQPLAPHQAVESYCQARQLSPELRERITQRAYELFLERGETPGHELEDWVRAESEVLAACRRPEGPQED